MSVRKRNGFSLIALGTACSIFLQSTVCYSLAWANAAEDANRVAVNEAAIDEASMLISGTLPPGLQDTDLNPSAKFGSSDNETVIDASTIEEAKMLAQQVSPEAKALATSSRAGHQHTAAPIEPLAAEHGVELL